MDLLTVSSVTMWRRLDGQTANRSRKLYISAFLSPLRSGDCWHKALTIYTSKADWSQMARVQTHGVMPNPRQVPSEG